MNEIKERIEIKMRKYRVWMHGSSMTATYDGYEEDAQRKAKHKLTCPGGTFSDWSPSMFTIKKIELKYD